MREIWTFHSAGQLVFGPGSVERLRELAVVATATLRAAPASGGRNAAVTKPRVFLVTDAPLVKAGVVSEVATALGDLPHEVFAGGQPEPSLDLAEQCIAKARAYRPDVLLGLGGGSNMDLAKVTAACLAHNRPPRDFVGETGEFVGGFGFGNHAVPYPSPSWGGKTAKPSGWGSLGTGVLKAPLHDWWLCLRTPPPVCRCAASTLPIKGRDEPR